MVTDQSIDLVWIDNDTPIATGTATVNLFYTDAMPPTFEPGTRPDTIVGMPIVEGIIEHDTTNRYTWDTSGVSAGVYWVWSLVIEPPLPNPSPQIIRFTDVPIVIAHLGDEVPPAVRVTNPDNPFVWSDRMIDIEYEAFDPSGTAKVRIEVGSSFDGTGFTVLAEDLPAVQEGSVSWDTSQLAEADWTIRAIITDDRGFEVTAYAKFFLLITHLQEPDAGVAPDTGPAPTDLGSESPDSGILDTDLGPMMKLPKEPKSGCTCAQKKPSDGSRAALLIAVFALGLRRRWRRPSLG